MISWSNGVELGGESEGTPDDEVGDGEVGGEGSKNGATDERLALLASAKTSVSEPLG
jgi:hypothetical protein